MFFRNLGAPEFEPSTTKSHHTNVVSPLVLANSNGTSRIAKSPSISLTSASPLCFRPTNLKPDSCEKELDLLLCLPSHSAHPPGLLGGLVVGMLFCVLALTSDLSFSDARQDIRNLFLRLRNRGCQREHSGPTLSRCYKQVRRRPRPSASADPATGTNLHRNTAFFPKNASHLQY
jgi:hypothetical protein